MTTQSVQDPWKYLTLIDGKINYIIVGRIIKSKLATGVCLFTPNSIIALFCSIVDLFLKQLHDEGKLAANCVVSFITPCKIGKKVHGFSSSFAHNQDQLSKTSIW